MDRLRTDLFHLGGKNYLVVVDLFSGFKWCSKLKLLDSSKVIAKMEHWFSQGCGLPRVIRSDSGPQFRSQYNNWLEAVGVIRETSSAYNPRSNGLAEKGVQDLKKILKKQGSSFNLEKLVAEANNTARANMTATPAEMFMGRVVKSSTLGSSRRIVDLAKAHQQRLADQLRIKHRLGRGRLSRDVFQPGDRVRIQCPKSLRWSTTGTISRAIFHEGATIPSSYEIRLDWGDLMLRNGKYIRLREVQTGQEEQSDIHEGTQGKADKAAHEGIYEGSWNTDKTFCDQEGIAKAADKTFCEGIHERADTAHEGSHEGSKGNTDRARSEEREQGKTPRRSQRFSVQFKLDYKNGRRRLQGGRGKAKSRSLSPEGR